MTNFLRAGPWFPTDPPVELDSTLDTTWFVICPHCHGAGEIRIPATTAGEPQPEEVVSCPLCYGVGDVAETTAALYAAEGIEGVLAAQRKAEDCTAVGVKYPF